MKKPKRVKMPSKKAQELLTDYVESSGYDRTIFAYIAELEAKVKQTERAVFT
jgi:hypothetical protein